MGKSVFSFQGFNRGVNYGYDKIRFPATVPVGSRVRLGAKVLKCDDVPNGVQTTIELTVEVEGSDKPACVAELVFRFYGVGQGRSPGRPPIQ